MLVIRITCFLSEIHLKHTASKEASFIVLIMSSSILSLNYEMNGGEPTLLIYG